MLERWTDFSKWQGAVSTASLQAMQRDGVVGVCVGAWHGLDANPYVRGVLQRARAIGLKTAIYIVINNRPGPWTVDQAKAAVGADEWGACYFHAADVEIRGVAEDILQAALDQIAGLDGYPCIYTGAWFWNMWRPQRDFTRYGLWTALYNGRQDLAFPPYGGWDKLIGHQYAGTTHIYGTSVDLNVFDSEWIDLAKRRGQPVAPPLPPPPAPGEEIDMSSTEYTALVKKIDGLKSWVQKKVHDPIVARLVRLEARVAAFERRKPAPAPAPPRWSTYTVVAGDSLSGIAAKLGIADWRTIYNANKGVIGGDPNMIRPGMVLTIP